MGAAEQQQFSQYPLRYGDGTLGAAIAQTRGGRDELITPVALWELDDSSGLYLPPGLSQNPRRPRVDAQLSGRKVSVATTTLTTTPLAARGQPGSTYQSPVRDLTSQDAHLAYGLVIYTDTFTAVRVGVQTPTGSWGNENNTLLFGVLPNYLTWLPPFRLPVSRFYWKIENLSDSAQSTLEVYEVATDYLPYSPANLRSVLVYNMPIRDVSEHSSTPDPAYMLNFRRTLIGGAKSPVLVNNRLNQAVTVKVYLVTVNVGAGKVYEVNVPAGSTIYITNAEAPALDVPYEELYLRLQCSVEPTSGSVWATVDSLVGGTA